MYSINLVLPLSMILVVWTK